MGKKTNEKQAFVLSVVAPGFGLKKRSLKLCESYLKQKSYRNENLSSLFGEDLLCSHHVKKRSRSFEQALKKGGIIWCLRGGYGCVHLLPFLAKFSKPLKRSVLLGYSDVTALHSFLHKFWDWPTLHGPLLDGVVDGVVGPKYIKQLERFLEGQIKEVSYQLKPMNSLAMKVKNLKGVTKGGNLSVLQTLIGTDFCPEVSGCFLFLEDIGEKSYRVHRMLVHLKQAGLLKGLKAILLGSFIAQGGKKEQNLLEVVLKNWAKKEVKVPVFYGLPSGHGKDQALLPLNIKSTLRKGKLIIPLQDLYL